MDSPHERRPPETHAVVNVDVDPRVNEDGGNDHGVGLARAVHDDEAQACTRVQRQPVIKRRRTHTSTALHLKFQTALGNCQRNFAFVTKGGSGYFAPAYVAKGMERLREKAREK